MKKLFALAVLFACGIVQAAPVTWTFENAFFDDGGQATGSFVYDAELQTYSNVNVVTSAGSDFAGNLYTDCWQCVNASGNNVSMVDSDWVSGGPGISIFAPSFAEFLTDAGGVVALRTDDICPFFCEWNRDGTVNRRIVSGQVSSVPIPAAVWLFASGLGLLGWMRRRYLN